jgi:modification methylase
MAERLPVTSVWLTCQRPAREQRRGRYVADTSRHPAKMLPDAAAHAVKAYAAPGELVMDPMCGAGTTVVEAVRSGRDGIGVDIEPRFTAIAQANLALAATHGFTSWGQVVTGDSTNLAALLPASSHGQVSLVLTSPPYGRATHGLVRTVPGAGVSKRETTSTATRAPATWPTWAGTGCSTGGGISSPAAHRCCAPAGCSCSPAARCAAPPTT